MVHDIRFLILDDVNESLSSDSNVIYLWDDVRKFVSNGKNYGTDI